jgi:hypothetical protein
VSIAWGMILVGVALIASGIKNVSLAGALRGDLTQPKPAASPGGGGAPAATATTATTGGGATSAPPSGYAAGSRAGIH